MPLTTRWFPSHLLDITDDECQFLLEQASVGRVAYTAGHEPAVIPVNYVLDGRDVLFRTSSRSDLGRHLNGRPVAFEIDDFDPFNQSGWSILVRGVAEYVEQGSLPEELRPEPWAGGDRDLIVRITTRLITGRRLVAI